MRKLQKVVKNYLIHKLNWHWLSTFLYWAQSKVNQCSWLPKGKHNGCGLHHPHQPLQPTRWLLQVTLNSFCHNTSRREVFSHKITTHSNPSPKENVILFIFVLHSDYSSSSHLNKSKLNSICTVLLLFIMILCVSYKKKPWHFFYELLDVTKLCVSY